MSNEDPFATPYMTEELSFNDEEARKITAKRERDKINKEIEAHETVIAGLNKELDEKDLSEINIANTKSEISHYQKKINELKEALAQVIS